MKPEPAPGAGARPGRGADRCRGCRPACGSATSRRPGEEENSGRDDGCPTRLSPPIKFGFSRSRSSGEKHGAAEDFAGKARRVAFDDADDALGIGLLAPRPIASPAIAPAASPRIGAAARAPAPTARACPAGARDGSIAVGWPTTSTGSAGSRPAESLGVDLATSSRGRARHGHRRSAAARRRRASPADRRARDGSSSWPARRGTWRRRVECRASSVRRPGCRTRAADARWR